MIDRFLASAACVAYIASAGVHAAPQSGITASGFSMHWGSSNPDYDLNGDGVVNAMDLSLFLASGGDTAPVGSTGTNNGGNSGTEGSTGALPVLSNGTGFAGITPTPARIGPDGEPSGDERAIARWVDVPCQVRSGRIEVGVVAYHANGIERVEFSLNGGPWTAIEQAKYSPTFDIDCYTTEVDLAGIPAGSMAEIRAIVYPRTAGQPMVLQNAATMVGNPDGVAGIDGIHSFFVMRTPADRKEIFVSPSGSNSHPGTATQPVATIARALDLLRIANGANGGLVTLATSGTYAAPFTTSVVVNNAGWTTIRAADGLEPNSVRIVSTTASGTQVGANPIRTRFKRLCWKGVYFDMSAVRQLYGDSSQFLWVDGCRFQHPNGAVAHFNVGGTYPMRPSTTVAATYATNSFAQDVVHGFNNVSLVRGCYVRKILGDAYANSRCVLSSALSDFIGQTTAIHSDAFQYWGVQRNNIVSRFRAWNIDRVQNFLFDWAEGTELTDCAFVDIAIENLQQNPNAPKSQLSNEMKNVLFMHMSAPNQYWILRDDHPAPNTFTADSVVFSNCVLSWMSRASDGARLLPPGVNVTHTHFCLPSGMPTGTGTFNLTSGPLVLDANGFLWTHVGPASGALLGNALVLPGLTNTEHPDRGPLPGGVEASRSSAFALEEP